MTNLGWWAAALGALGLGVVVKKKLDARPQLGDVAIVPLGKVQLNSPGTPLDSLSTPLADGTIAVTLLSSADPAGRIAGSVRNVLGITLPVFVFQPDILRLTRNGAAV